jgi:hypothetical protein
VADAGSLHGDVTEEGLKGEGPGATALDARAPLAVADLEDQFGVGLLDEGLEELALDLDADPMDMILDLVREVLVLGRQWQGGLEFKRQRENLGLAVDGGKRDGSVESA